MDGEQTKPLREDQMDMMLMMQMDKASEVCGQFADVNELPSMDFSDGAAPTIFEALPLASPPLISPPANLPFVVGSAAQEAAALPAIFPVGMARRLGNVGELPSATPSQKRNSVAAMREMIFRIAAMQPIHIDPESVKAPKRRNVKISKDPQSVAARHRRERISERIRILQRLVPGGTKMDTASMLDEAIHYVKFLKTQVQSLEQAASSRSTGVGFPTATATGISNHHVNGYSFLAKRCQPPQNFGSTQLLS